MDLLTLAEAEALEQRIYRLCESVGVIIPAAAWTATSGRKTAESRVYWVKIEHWQRVTSWEQFVDLLRARLAEYSAILERIESE